MQSLSRIDKYRGTMVGVHVGDSLGAPYEQQSRATIEADIKQRGGLTYFDYIDAFRKDLDWKGGRPTDDSELTAALAMSLVESGGCHLEDQYFRYRTIVHGGKSVLYDGPAQGFGGTTKKMLMPETYLASRQLPNPPAIPTNGSLMRTAPVALMFCDSPEYMARVARDASSVTHLNPIAGSCCVVYCDILQQVLDGIEPEEAIFGAFDVPLNKQFLSKEIEKIGQNALSGPPPAPEKKTWGGAAYSLHAALWAFSSATSFEDGIEKAICIGGDTDTYAAIAGALLGAYFGYESIPVVWRDGIMGKDKMLSLADSLYKMSKLRAAA